LLGLYEQWFRRQFVDATHYEVFVPLLEVLVAAERPMPEPWLDRIFGWSVRERAQLLEGLGTLFERGPKGIAPFHKSLRDWLTDDRAAGPDFVIDAAIGRQRITDVLWPEFSGWAESNLIDQLDDFVVTELTAQVASGPAFYPRLEELARLLSDPATLARKVFVGTDVGEDRRRRGRHLLRELVARTAQEWPDSLDPSLLWNIILATNGLAWSGIYPMPNLALLILWDDIGMPEANRAYFAPHLRYYEEWNERVLLLVTAIDMAQSVTRVRPELVPRVGEIFDQRLSRFMSHDGPDFGVEVLKGTAGREYIPERNLSFLTSSIRLAVDTVKADPRLSGWASSWDEFDK
jgi:hypothetical protein